LILSHKTKKPRIHSTAYVAPTAVVCGDVEIGPRCCILFGAAIVSEGGTVRIGSDTIVMENAVLRGVPGNDLYIGRNCIIGPHSHLTGCVIEDECFIATNVCIFNGAIVRRNCGIRIGGIVHINSELEAQSVVPIGWIAIGKPAQLFPPSEHDLYNDLLARLDFAKTVFRAGKRLDGYMDVAEATTRYAKFLKSHLHDRLITC
jgi:carbonic anhydrase/acetyltransferase-like protein (isoleucine patch superfamily)